MNVWTVGQDLKIAAVPGSIAGMAGGKSARRGTRLAIAAAAAATMLVAGCARTLHNTDAALREQGLGDRCADFMQRAFPGANIKITNVQAAPDPGSGTLATMVARVDGVRPKVSEDQAITRREVAVACRFENGILTSFRWILGPLQ